MRRRIHCRIYSGGAACHRIADIVEELPIPHSEQNLPAGFSAPHFAQCISEPPWRDNIARKRDPIKQAERHRRGLGGQAGTTERLADPKIGIG